MKVTNPRPARQADADRRSDDARLARESTTADEMPTERNTDTDVIATITGRDNSRDNNRVFQK